MDTPITTLESIPEDRAADILSLRKLAIDLIGKSGRWERIGNTPMMMVKDHGGLTIIYMTPFQRRAGSKERQGYALSISADADELLSLAWKTPDATLVEKYEPGEWETLLKEPALTASLAA